MLHVCVYIYMLSSVINKFCFWYTGSRPGSQAGSVASLKMRDVYRPSSVMSSRAASRADMLPEEEEEEVDQEGLGKCYYCQVVSWLAMHAWSSQLVGMHICAFSGLFTFSSSCLCNPLVAVIACQMTYWLEKHCLIGCFSDWLTHSNWYWLTRMTWTW